MALQADSTGTYRGTVLVEAPALPRRPPTLSSLTREARLAYTILTPTLLVILFLVAYPFFAAIYLSLQNKMVGARALDECHKKIVEIYTRYEKG